MSFGQLSALSAPCAETSAGLITGTTAAQIVPINAAAGRTAQDSVQLTVYHESAGLLPMQSSHDCGQVVTGRLMHYASRPALEHQAHPKASMQCSSCPCLHSQHALCLRPADGGMREGWSTTHPNDEEVHQGMRHFLNNALPDMQGIEDTILSRAAQLLRRLAPRPLYEAVWQ